MGFLDYFRAEDAYLALTKVQGGLSQGSLTGNTYWVDSSDANAADAGGRGTISAPFASIDYAIDVITALDDPTAGHVILVKSGHTEDIESAAAIDLDINNVAVVGLGHGLNRPLLTFKTLDTATIEVAATGVRIENIRFRNEIADLAVAITVTDAGAGFRLVNCDFTISAAATVILKTIAAAAADVAIVGNRFNYAILDTDAASVFSNTGSTDRLTIAENYIDGRFSPAVIDLGSTSADILVVNNKINNRVSAVQGILSVGANTTGSCCDNKGYSVHATPFDTGSAVAFAENYFSDDLTKSGILSPADS